MSFIAANKVYTNTNKTTIRVWDKATLRAPLSGTFLQTARFSYATEGALFISAQLSSDAVNALRKVRVLI